MIPILLVSLLAQLVLGGCEILSSLNLGTSDSEIRVMIGDRDMGAQTEECLRLLFDKGYYNSCKYLLGRHPQFSHMLGDLITRRKTRINSLLDQLQMPTSVIQPSMKWAQNATHIFVHLKLSHRMDSPPCTNVKKQLVSSTVKDTSPGIQSIDNATNQSVLSYQCQCIVSHQRIVFKAQLDFWGNLTQLDLKKEGYGGITIMGLKSEPQIWRWLQTSHRRIAFWDQMKQKYKEDMEKYFALVEEDEQRTIKKNKKKRKRIQFPDQL